MNRRMMMTSMRAGGAAGLTLGQSAERNTRIILIVTSDGLRWRDVFRGAEEGPLTRKGGVSDAPGLYWRPTKEQRRQAPMPFLWPVVGKQGHLHGNRYDLHLDSVRREDSHAKELRGLAQSMPEYQGTTSLLMTVDHGRGNGPVWTGHGQKVPDSREVWMAMMGPDTRPVGERANVAPGADAVSR
ncbi:MAG: hypothetical protein HY821_24480 [Acidobacteria bacterium]|nr:hypothetical protein [Acidobacteriota bacterium]